MKRACAILVALAVLFGAMPAFAYDGAAFQLDFSNFDDSGSLADAAFHTDVTAMGGVTKQTAGFYYGDRSYLSFDGTGAIRAGEAPDAVFKNSSALSAALWLQVNSTGQTNARLFCIAGEAGVGMEAYVNTAGAKTYLYYRPAGFAAGQENAAVRLSADITQFCDKWSYFVFERQWDAQAETVTYAVSVNGTLLLSGTEAAAKQDETQMQLYIGSANNGASALRGSIGDVRLYTSILGRAAVKNIYRKQQKTYMAAPGNRLSFSSVTPMFGSASKPALIDARIGTITVQFNNYIEEDTIADHITLTAADDSELPGGVSAALGEDFKSVVLSFGSLTPETVYKLSIQSGLRAPNGAELQREVTGYYRSDRLAIIDDDFTGDGYVVGQAPPMDRGISYLSTGVDNNASGVEVKSVNGINYLSLSSSKLNANSLIYVKFPNPVASDYAAVMEMKVRPASLDASRKNGTAPRDVGRLLESMSNFLPLGSMTGGYVAGGATTLPDSSKDENGFYHVRIVAMYNQEQQSYYAMLYDMADLSKKPITFESPTIHVKTLTGFGVVHIYPYTDIAEAQSDRSEISSLKVYTVPSPALTGDNLRTVTPETDAIRLTVNDDINSATVNTDSVRLRDSQSGALVPCNVGISPENAREIRLDPLQYLEYNHAYEIELSGIKSAALGMTMPDTKLECVTGMPDVNATGCRITDQNGSPVTGILGATSLTAAVSLENNSGSSSAVSVFAVLRDAQGRKRAGVYTQKDVPPGEDTLSVTLDTVQPEAGDTLYVYVWSNLDTSPHLMILPPFVIKA